MEDWLPRSPILFYKPGTGLGAKREKKTFAVTILLFHFGPDG
jgi:hypothetical protein